MPVVTIVEGTVSPARAREFEAAYAALGPLPPGLLESRLIKNTAAQDLYRIETVWESQEALEKYRRTDKTPAAIALFQKMGANPKVEIYDLCQSLH